MKFNNIYLFLQNTIDAVANDSITSTNQNSNNVVAILKDLSVTELIPKVVDGVITLGIRILLSFIVFYIGKFLIGKLVTVFSKVLTKRKIEASLYSFLLSLLRIVLLFILVISIIGILGIETSSFVAIFASAGVTIGLALSGTLQNFAGGVIILFTKPYRVGDFIEHNNLSGTVREIQIFSTIINTPDNKIILIPNGGLATGTIINYSTEVYRRITWTFTISYGDDIKVARETILKILTSDERIVQTTCIDDYKKRPQVARNKLNGIVATIPKDDKSPKVYLGELAADSVNITVRAWVYTSFYWDVFYEVNEKVYNIFPKQGLNFPFPQLDVRVNNV
ncbi:MAG: mechanosensitive ion channel [Bacteroidales bacterium]|nr:mechanosensitive ion channel [Bacteroidales bacterium]